MLYIYRVKSIQTVMTQKALFPFCWKRIGWILFIPSVLSGLIWLLFEQPAPKVFDLTMPALIHQRLFNQSEFFTLTETNVLDELIGVMIIVSSILIAFSREKKEDEFIASLRLNSLVWATYVNYGILLLAILFVYEMSFFYVMILNMFTLLFFFIIRFHWLLYRSKKDLHHEEFSEA